MRLGSAACSASARSCAFGVGGEHPIDDALLSARRFLRNVPDAGHARNGDRAHVGREIAADDFQQRRLAGTVAADEAHLVAGGNASGRALEDGAALDAVAEVVDVQHGEHIAPPARPVTTAMREEFHAPG